MEARQYPLFVPRLLTTMVFIILIFMTLTGAGLIAFSFMFPVDNAPPPFVGIVWLLFLIIPWYWIVTLPYRIEADQNAITFKALLGKKMVKVEDIISITPDKGQLGFLILRHTKGKIRLLNQFDHFHDLLNQVEHLNPAIVLRGC